MITENNLTHNTKHKPECKLHTTADITTVSHAVYTWTSWTTQHALSSSHLPIISTINIRHDYGLQQNRLTFTNYKKADWTQFTEDTQSAFAQTTIKGEPPPECVTCNFRLTISHILVDCIEYDFFRLIWFENNFTLTDIFNNVSPNKMLLLSTHSHDPC